MVRLTDNAHDGSSHASVLVARVRHHWFYYAASASMRRVPKGVCLGMHLCYALLIAHASTLYSSACISSHPASAHFTHSRTKGSPIIMLSCPRETGLVESDTISEHIPGRERENGSNS